MYAPDNDPTVLQYQFPGYDDPTGKPVPSGEAMRRGYTPVTTDTPGQHIHNTAGDPTDQRDIVEDNDLHIDTTP